MTATYVIGPSLSLAAERAEREKGPPASAPSRRRGSG
jgi:hypothetical protein